MPFKLVPRKLARLGASLGVRDAACAAEDGPVEGEDPCPLDKLAEMGKEIEAKMKVYRPRGLFWMVLYPGGEEEGNEGEATYMVQAQGLAQPRRAV